MKLFVAASYSTQVNYDNGEVNPEYQAWLEQNLKALEAGGHQVFCALREDQYKINQADPAAAFELDLKHIKEADGLVAFVTEKPSAGVQTEVGVAVALGRPVFLAHDSHDKLLYFNQAMLQAGVVKELILPLTPDSLKQQLHG